MLWSDKKRMVYTVIAEMRLEGFARYLLLSFHLFHISFIIFFL